MSMWQTPILIDLNMDPIDDPDFKRIAPELKRILKDIHQHLRFHDLRVDKTTTPETIYFDLVVPEDLKKVTNSQLQDQFWSNPLKVRIINWVGIKMTD
jgi:hypothetical protein